MRFRSAAQLQGRVNSLQARLVRVARAVLAEDMAALREELGPELRKLQEPSSGGKRPAASLPSAGAVAGPGILPASAAPDESRPLYPARPRGVA